MKTTPIGILSGFVALESPSTKFNDDGIYTCEMDFTGDAILTMKDQISIALKDSRIKYREGNVKEASPPYKIENDVLTVRFKQKAKIVSRSGKSYEKTITIYDAAGKKVDELLNIGAGTACKIAYSHYAWAVASLGYGITLQPAAVQVLDLVERSLDGTVNPFSEENGTFVAAEKDVNPFEKDADF